MECRASGLTDHGWCLQNDIKPGTFYNWVKRLRQKGCIEILDALKGHIINRKEIVKIELTPLDIRETAIATIWEQNNLTIQNGIMEFSSVGTVLHIPNGTDTVLRGQLLHIPKELSCQAIDLELTVSLDKPCCRVD